MTVASVVVPAHNEEHGLHRCLAALLADARPGEFDVVVVANACTDRTSDIARGFADRGVRCVETPVPSKSNALNLGDAAVRQLPRIYLDADVVISTAAAREMAWALTDRRFLAAAPRLHVDTTGANRLASAYVRVWESLPVFDSGYVGSGCYALSAEGRARFDRFPDLIGDDLFVNRLFRPSEKLTLSDHQLRTFAPRHIRGIVHRGLRVRAGTLQAAATSSPPTRTLAHLRTLARRPANLLDVAVFAAVQVVIVVAARWRRLRRHDHRWLRDESSRQ